ncbi:hypothetical protein CEXT_536061 [Caerostris extrusa]|uniref:Uncharacterized protein n=1 Tax=Caerostris extrusa TaxID=172846 RepID=A0AAV4Q8K7_CAEEX|nr:hypothetical protein CEXT_536061 [Caerostris extrusa]
MRCSLHLILQSQSSTRHCLNLFLRLSEPDTKVSRRNEKLVYNLALRPLRKQLSLEWWCTEHNRISFQHKAESRFMDHKKSVKKLPQSSSTPNILRGLT